MSFTPQTKQATEIPGIPATTMPWSDTMLQHAASGQPKESVQECAQSHSNDQAQDLQSPSELMQKVLLSNHREKDVEIMRKVFKDRKACDTVFVCHLMSPVWGEFQEDDIARVIQARGVCKFDDDFGAKSQWKKWLKVEEQISSRGGEKDRNDKDENAAWNIWSDAKAKLEQLKELDKRPLEADDGKLTSRRGSHPT